MRPACRWDSLDFLLISSCSQAERDGYREVASLTRPGVETYRMRPSAGVYLIALARGIRPTWKCPTSVLKPFISFNAIILFSLCLDTDCIAPVSTIDHVSTPNKAKRRAPGSLRKAADARRATKSAISADIGFSSIRTDSLHAEVIEGTTAMQAQSLGFRATLSSS